MRRRRGGWVVGCVVFNVLVNQFIKTAKVGELGVVIVGGCGRAGVRHCVVIIMLDCGQGGGEEGLALTVMVGLGRRFGVDVLCLGSGTGEGGERGCWCLGGWRAGEGGPAVLKGMEAWAWFG